MVDPLTDPTPAVPYADEANPALGRRSGIADEDRRQSGGLTDDSPEDPVVDPQPFRPRTVR